MATSGSYDFSLNRNQIITSALMVIQAYDPGVTPTDSDMVDCGRFLNAMIKGWQAEGIGLWLNKEITLLLEDDGTSYNLGPTGDHASLTVVKTEVATAASSGDSTLVVDSITGISDADNIGIELDDGTVQWTTVNGTPAAATITLTAALTDDVAVDNHVYNYTTIIQRPLEIIEARRVDSDDNETPLQEVSRDEYMALSVKTTTGPTNQYYYDPQLTNGVLYCWPACDDVKDRINMTVKYPVQDFDAATDDADFPPEWTEALIFNLAVRLAPIFGTSMTPESLAIAISSKEAVRGFDGEKGSIFFQPELR